MEGGYVPPLVYFSGIFLNPSVTGKNGFGFEGLPSCSTSEAETKVPNQFILQLISVALITSVDTLLNY